MKSLLILFLYMTPLIPTFANVRVMPRSTEDYNLVGIRLNESPTIWVEGSTLAWVNYSALKRDFPTLQKYNHQQIDELLLLNFSYISETQVKLGEMRNTSIPVDPLKKKLGFRPPSYGRADVLEFFDFDGTSIGIIDRKGAGVNSGGLRSNKYNLQKLGPEKIQTNDHSDGLMTLGEAIAETTRQQARQILYQIESVDAETVESYFVMMLPFRIKKGKGNTDPAAVYARQAHIGRTYDFKTPLPKSESGVLQQDYFSDTVDQGAVRVKDPRLDSTFRNFGKKIWQPQKRADWVWAHETATAFSNNPDRSIVERHIHQMLAPISGIETPPSLTRRKNNFKEEMAQFFEAHSFSPLKEHRAMAALALSRLPSREMMSLWGRERYYRTLNSFLTDSNPTVQQAAIYGMKAFDEKERSHYIILIAKTGTLRVIKTLLRYTLNDEEKVLILRTISTRIADTKDSQISLLKTDFKRILKQIRFKKRQLQRDLEVEFNSVLYQDRPSTSRPVLQCKSLF